MEMRTQAVSAAERSADVEERATKADVVWGMKASIAWVSTKRRMSAGDSMENPGRVPLFSLFLCAP